MTSDTVGERTGASGTRDSEGRTVVLLGEMTPADSAPPAMAAPNEPLLLGEPAFVRFRDRVRAHVGSAELLAFRIGRERFAFDIRAVDEVLDDVVVQALPDSPPALVGIVTYAERPIPVFEPAHFLGIEHDVGGTVLIMRSGRRRIGLLVDDVDEVETVDLSTIAPPPFESGDEMLLGVLWRDQALTAIVDARTLIGACHLVAAGSAR